MPRFADRTALVTGASSGIGQAICVGLAREGARVCITYHSDEAGAQETARSARDAREAAGLPPQDDLVVALDVGEPESVKAAFAVTLRAFGRLDVLVNNAGMQLEAPAHETDIESFDGPIRVNLRGAFLCARAAIRHFLDRGDGGVIINISSVHETIPKPFYIGYSASKGGLQNLNRTLALEYAKQGIRVNSVAPGAIATPINPWADDPKERAKVAAHIPMERAGETEDLVPAVLFLASDEARYITGQTLFVDGGLALYPDFRTAWSS